MQHRKADSVRIKAQNARQGMGIKIGPRWFTIENKIDVPYGNYPVFMVTLILKGSEGPAQATFYRYTNIEVIS